MSQARKGMHIPVDIDDGGDDPEGDGGKDVRPARALDDDVPVELRGGLDKLHVEYVHAAFFHRQLGHLWGSIPPPIVTSKSLWVLDLVLFVQYSFPRGSLTLIFCLAPFKSCPPLYHYKQILLLACSLAQYLA